MLVTGAEQRSGAVRGDGAGRFGSYKRAIFLIFEFRYKGQLGNSQ